MSSPYTPFTPHSLRCLPTLPAIRQVGISNGKVITQTPSGSIVRNSLVTTSHSPVPWRPESASEPRVGDCSNVPLLGAPVKLVRQLVEATSRMSANNGDAHYSRIGRYIAVSQSQDHRMELTGLGGR